MVAMVPGLAVVYGVVVATGAGGDSERALSQLFDQVFGAVPQLREVLFPLLSAVDLRALGAVAMSACWWWPLVCT